MKKEIKVLKDLYSKTHLVENGKSHSRIVIPQKEIYRRWGREIAERIKKKSGVDIPIKYDFRTGEEDLKEENIIALGNLGDNSFIEKLYCQWYTLVDLWYPGKNGYVIRTIHNPTGSGHNVIFLGGSDISGISQAVSKFTHLLREKKSLSLPRLSLIKTAPLSIKSLDTHLNGPDFRYPLIKNGLLYYATGNEKYGRKYKKEMLKLASDPEEFNPDRQVHLRFYPRIILWDLLEEEPIFTNQERLKITNYILNILRSKEGIKNSWVSKEKLSQKIPRQNHATRIGLALFFGGRYFSQYYHLSEAKEWLQRARKLFSIQENSSKPICDEMSQQYGGTLEHMTTYALASGEMSFLKDNYLKEAVNRAIVSSDNQGTIPEVGDGKREAYATLLFLKAAHYYQDGRYLFMVKKSYPEFFNTEKAILAHTFYGGIKSSSPSDMVGVKSTPLSALFYHTTQNLLPGQKGSHGSLKPNIPFSKTFDKISFRSGFNKNDQYLLLDGVGYGDHSYEDTNSILELSENRKRFLITNDSIYHQNFCYHNVVMIIKNGEGKMVPAFAGLEKLVDLSDFGFTRTFIKNYNSVDWFRNIFWKKNAYFLIIDELQIREKGKYAFACKWKTPGIPKLSGKNYQTVQGESKFFIKNLNGNLSCRIEEVHPPTLIKPIFPIHILSQRSYRNFKEGEKESFINLLYASSNRKKRDYGLYKMTESIIEIKGKGKDYFGFGNKVFSYQDLDVKTTAFFLSEDSFALIAGISLKKKELFWESSFPVDIEYDFYSGKGMAVSSKKSRFKLVVGQPERVLVDHQPVEFKKEFSKRKDTLLSFDFPAGEHSLEATPVSQKISWSFKKSQLDRVPRIEVKRERRLKKIWEYKTKNRISSLCISNANSEDKRIVVASEDNYIHLLNTQGKVLWKYKTGGRVNSVYAKDVDKDGREEIVVGSDDCNLYLLDSQGKKRWSFKPEFGCQPWPWWTLGKSMVKKVFADDLDNDGKDEILAGVANMHLYCLDYQGRMRWKFRTCYGTFDNFYTADVNNDGKKEIIGGTSKLSCGNVCRIIDCQGRQIGFYNNEGSWTSALTALAVNDLEEKGKLKVACGTNRGDNLRLFDAKSSRREWKYNLGEPVTAIHFADLDNDGKKELIVGSESSYLFLFDTLGRKKWFSHTEAGITFLATADLDCNGKQEIIVGSKNGKVTVLDGKGNRLAFHKTEGEITSLRAGSLEINGKPTIIVGSGDGKVYNLKL